MCVCVYVRARKAAPHPAIVNERTMSRIMHNELFRADALMQRTMMRARAPEHKAKERWVGGATARKQA